MSKKIRNLFLMLALVLVTAFAVLLGTGTNVKAGTSNYYSVDYLASDGQTKTFDTSKRLTEVFDKILSDGKLLRDATIEVFGSNLVDSDAVVNFTGSDATLDLQNHTLTLKSLTLNGGNLTIKNGKLYIKDGAPAVNGGSLVIESDASWVVTNTAELNTVLGQDFPSIFKENVKRIQIQSDAFILGNPLTINGRVVINTQEGTEKSFSLNGKTITVAGVNTELTIAGDTVLSSDGTFDIKEGATAHLFATISSDCTINVDTATLEVVNASASIVNVSGNSANVEVGPIDALEWTCGAGELTINNYIRFATIDMHKDTIVAVNGSIGELELNIYDVIQNLPAGTTTTKTWYVSTADEFEAACDDADKIVLETNVDLGGKTVSPIVDVDLNGKTLSNGTLLLTKTVTVKGGTILAKVLAAGEAQQTIILSDATLSGEVIASCGTLEIKGNGYDFADRGNLTVKEAATVTVSPYIAFKKLTLDGITSNRSFNIRYSELEVKDCTGKITVNGKEQNNDHYDDHDKITINGGEVILNDDATIDAHLEISNNAKVTTNKGIDGNVTIDSDGTVVTINGDVTGNVTVNAGKLTINGNVTGNVTVNGGELTINGNVVKTTNNGNVTVSNGAKVTITGTIAGKLTVNGCEVTVGSDGTTTDKTVVTGGVEVISSDATVTIYGNVTGNVVVGKENVVNITTVKIFGSVSNGSVTLRKNAILVITGNAIVNGITVDGTLTVNKAVEGDVVVNGGDVVIVGNVTGDLEVNGGKVQIGSDADITITGTITIKGGEVILKKATLSDDKLIIHFVNSDATLTLNNVTFTDNKDLVKVESDACIQSDGYIDIPYYGAAKEGQYVAVASDGTLLGSDGTFYSEVFADENGKLWLRVHTTSTVQYFTYHANKIATLAEVLDAQLHATPEYIADNTTKIVAYINYDHEVRGYISLADAINNGVRRDKLGTVVELYDVIDEPVNIVLAEDEVYFDVQINFNNKDCNVFWLLGGNANYMLSDVVNDKGAVIGEAYTFYQLLVEYQAHAVTTGNARLSDESEYESFSYAKIDYVERTIKVENPFTLDTRYKELHLALPEALGTAITTVKYADFFDANGKPQKVVVWALYNSYAAVIGTTGYDTYEEAFKAVKDNETIKLYEYINAKGETVNKLSGWQFVPSASVKTFTLEKYDTVRFSNLVVTGATDDSVVEARFTVNTLSPTEIVLSRRSTINDIIFYADLFTGKTAEGEEEVDTDEIGRFKNIAWGTKLNTLLAANLVDSHAKDGVTFDANGYPVLDGFEFKGWVLNDGTPYQLATSEMKSDVLKLYATWSLVEPKFDGYKNLTYNFGEQKIYVSHAGGDLVDLKVNGLAPKTDTDGKYFFTVTNAGTYNYTLTASAKTVSGRTIADKTATVEFSVAKLNLSSATVAYTVAGKTDKVYSAVYTGNAQDPSGKFAVTVNGVVFSDATFTATIQNVGTYDIVMGSTNDNVEGTYTLKDAYTVTRKAIKVVVESDATIVWGNGFATTYDYDLYDGETLLSKTSPLYKNFNPTFRLMNKTTVITSAGDLANAETVLSIDIGSDGFVNNTYSNYTITLVKGTLTVKHAVAVADSTYYETLAEAVQNATSSVKLVDDIVLDETIEIDDKNVEIDLDKHTVSGNKNCTLLFDVTDNSNQHGFTIRNGRLINNYGNAIEVNGGALNITMVYIKAKTYAVKTDNAVVNINNASEEVEQEIIAKNALKLDNLGTGSAIHGGKFNGTVVLSRAIIYEGKFTSKWGFATNGKSYMTNTGDADYRWVVDTPAALLGNEAFAKLEDAIDAANRPGAQTRDITLQKTLIGDVVLNGEYRFNIFVANNSITFDPASIKIVDRATYTWKAQGKEFTTGGKTGFEYESVKNLMVIGSDGYATLDEAMENIKNGETITLKSNLSAIDLVIPEGKTIVLDLNGFSLTSGCITVRGNLLIKNSNKVAVAEIGCQIMNNGTLKIYADVTINGDEVHFNNENATMIIGSDGCYPKYQSTLISYGDLIVHGGDLANIQLQETGMTTINDGTLEVLSVTNPLHLIMNGGYVKLPDGEYAAAFYWDAQQKKLVRRVDVNVQGAEFIRAGLIKSSVSTNFENVEVEMNDGKATLVRGEGFALAGGIGENGKTMQSPIATPPTGDEFLAYRAYFIYKKDNRYFVKYSYNVVKLTAADFSE